MVAEHSVDSSMEGTELEQMRVFIARQEARLDQLQQQLQQQQAHQARARQASAVGQDLSELGSIVHTRVMEKIPIFDGTEAHFVAWRFTFEVTLRTSGLGTGAEAVDLVDPRRGKPQRFPSAARCLLEEQGCVPSPGCVVQRPSAGSCPRSAKACWTRGMASVRWSVCMNRRLAVG